MNDKQLVAIYAAQRVQHDMVVGLGTGSTANYFIEELARRCKEEQLRVTTVASSVVSTIKAQQHGLRVVAMEHLSRIDLYVDGADEITPELTLLKGRGFDLVREKLLARAADQFIVVADRSKLVGRIGEKFPIPIEVTPFAWQLAKHSLEQLGGQGDLRENGDGLTISSHGSLVLDMTFDPELDAAMLDAALSGTPGVVEHGIFTTLATTALIAYEGRVEELHAP
jgi:ribose 5-phosphate isomerase A